MSETTTTKAKNALQSCAQQAIILDCDTCSAALIRYQKTSDAKLIAEEANAKGWSAEISRDGELTYCPKCTKNRNTQADYGAEHGPLCLCNDCLVAATQAIVAKVPKFPDGHTANCLCDVCYEIKKEAIR